MRDYIAVQMPLLSSLRSPSNAANPSLVKLLDQGACFQGEPLKFVTSAEKYLERLKNYESNGPQKLFHELIASFRQFEAFRVTSFKQ